MASLRGQFDVEVPFPRTLRRRSALGCVTLCLLLLTVACADGGEPKDPLQVVEDPVAAEPADSPEPTEQPAGTVIGIGGAVDAMVIEPETRTIVVARQDSGGAYVEYYSLEDVEAKPRRVRVPGPVHRLEPTGDGHLLGAIPAADTVVRLTPADSTVGRTEFEGAPVSAVKLGTRTLVALRDKRAIEVTANEEPEKTITGELASADQVLVADGKVAVLDRLRSALFEVDVDDGDIGLGLRAGQGATNAVTDRFGRVLVVDTRRGALLAFSLDPLVLRQRFPVPGAPYGIAYDHKRDLAWVTLTGRNEVVAYDVAGGEPVKKDSFPTVRQPNSVTVDEHTGSVVVASSSGDGIQVIEP